jgi:hypothetical protein
MQRLRVNAPAVVHKTIDSETVIINLERGIYYSLDRVGVDVWAGIDAGMDREGVLALVSRRWSGDPDRMRDGVLGLIEEMKTEVLIVEDAQDAGPGDAAGPGGPPEAGPGPFEPPVLRKSTDLHDLLLLDPIHQVDEAGWPERGPDGSGGPR